MNEKEVNEMMSLRTTICVRVKIKLESLKVFSLHFHTCCLLPTTMPLHESAFIFSLGSSYKENEVSKLCLLKDENDIMVERNN